MTLPTDEGVEHTDPPKKMPGSDVDLRFYRGGRSNIEIGVSPLNSGDGSQIAQY